MKISHAFIIAVVANIVGAFVYDALKRKATEQRL